MSVPLYSAEQIRIPPELPDILKSYTKHIIREQPKDILAASVEYFSQLSKVTAKQRHRSSGIDTNSLRQVWRTLNAKYADSTNLPREDVVRACEEAGIQADGVADFVKIGNWTDTIPWKKFWGLAVGSTTETLPSTMQTVVALMAENGKVPTMALAEIFRFIAERDPDYSPSKIDTVTQAIMTDPTEVTVDTALDVLQTHLGGGKGS